MSAIFILLTIIIGVGVLAYLRASLVVTTVAAAIGLLVLGKMTGGPVAKSLIR